MEKKKIMYIMNVPWNSIKQRHHFIAENLMKFYEVDIYLRHEFKYENPRSKSVHLLYRLPLQRYNSILKLNRWLLKKQISKDVNQYDIIWITTPQQYNLIAKSLRKDQVLIYDCMDDMLCFPEVEQSPELYQYIYASEKKVIERANFIFVSAHSLIDVLRQRYNITRNFFVINNGIENCQATYSPRHLDNNHNTKKIITYIGAIADWMDFSLLIKSLEQFQDIEYHFYGPVIKGTQIPSNKRMIYHGAVEHSQIYNIMEHSDLLIMPFVLKPLIMSVNPIKLYEYIKSDIPSLSIRYPETEKFANFVYLYRNEQEYLQVIDELCKNKLYKKGDVNEINKFLKQNTWETRAEQIKNIINNGNG